MLHSGSLELLSPDWKGHPLTKITSACSPLSPTSTPPLLSLTLQVPQWVRSGGASAFICIMPCKSLPIVINDKISFFMKAEQQAIVYTYHVLFIHRANGGRFCWHHILVLVDNTAVNTGTQVSLIKWFYFRQIYTHRWDFWIIRWLSFSFLEGSSRCFP